MFDVGTHYYLVWKSTFELVVLLLCEFYHSKHKTFWDFRDPVVTSSCLFTSCISGSRLD